MKIRHIIAGWLLWVGCCGLVVVGWLLWVGGIHYISLLHGMPPPVNNNNMLFISIKDESRNLSLRLPAVL